MRTLQGVTHGTTLEAQDINLENAFPWGTVHTSTNTVLYFGYKAEMCARKDLKMEPPKPKCWENKTGN